MSRQLTKKQQKFKEALLKGMNQTEAAITAGYAPESAHVAGHKLAKNPLIAGAMTRRDALVEKKSALDAEKVLAAANNLMDFDPAELFDDNGKLLRIKEMPLEARRAIQSIDYEKQTIKFVPRLGALELSAKLIGMLRNEPQQQTAIQIIVSPTMRDPEPESAPIVPVWE